MIEAFNRLHVNRQSPLVADLFQLADELAIVDFSLADTDLVLVLRRVAQVNVLHVLDRFVDFGSLMRTGDVMRRNWEMDFLLTRAGSALCEAAPQMVRILGGKLSVAE